MNPQSLSEAYLAVVAPLCSLEIWVLVRFGFEDVAASLLQTLDWSEHSQNGSSWVLPSFHAHWGHTSSESCTLSDVDKMQCWKSYVTFKRLYCSKLHSATLQNTFDSEFLLVIYIYIIQYIILYNYILHGIYIYMIPPSDREVPPQWDGSPGSTPLPYCLQAIGSISEVQPRIC